MRRFLWALILVFIAAIAVAEDNNNANNNVTVKVGGTIFGDYSYTANDLRPSQFQITRAYINITGNVGTLLSFRITPDVSRENGANSSQTFRLKYAYGQVNLDSWTTKGS